MAIQPVETFDTYSDVIVQLLIWDWACEVCAGAAEDTPTRPEGQSLNTFTVILHVHVFLLTVT